MSETYFTFPVSVLAYGEHKIMRESALLHALMLYGTKTWPDGNSDEEEFEAIEAYCEKGNCEWIGDPAEAQMVLSAARLNVEMRGGTIEHRVAQARKFVAWHRGQERSNVRVRIRGDLFWDWHGGGMVHRRFAVLCAIYSRVGSKAWAKVTAQDIQRMAAGLCSRDEMERHERGEVAAGEILTLDQIRTTVNQLRASSLITRFTYNRGETFYSHPKKHPTEKDLAKTVLMSKARRAGMERDDARSADVERLTAFLKERKESQRI